MVNGVPSATMAEKSGVMLFKQWRLQHKVTALAVALGILPVLLTGTAAYLFASRSIGQQIVQEQIQRTEIISEKLDHFLVSRLREVESLAVNPVFTEKSLRDSLSPAQTKLILTEFSRTIRYFDSVILFDPVGNPVAQETKGKPFVGNYGNRRHFQQVLETGQSTMNGPELSPSSGKLHVEYAVPVTDTSTGTIVYVIRARVPGYYMNELFEILETHENVWHLLDSDGIIFAGAKPHYLAQSIDHYYPGLINLTRTQQTKAHIFTNAQEGNKRQLVSYAPVDLSTTLSAQPLGSLIAVDTAIALAPQYHLLRIFSLSIGLAAVGIGAIATFIANRAIRPIQHLTRVAQRVTRHSNFTLRAQVKGNDEIGLLANSLNQLIGSVGQYTKDLEQSQETLEQRVQERTEQLNAIIDNLGDGLLVIDTAGMIMRSNPTLINMFNLHDQVLEGQPCHRIFDAKLSQLIARNQIDPTQPLITNVGLANQGIGQALVTAVARDDAQIAPGGNFGSIVLIRDITAEKEIDQMKTDFISTVSHELRTPLTSVLGFTKLIQKKLERTILPAVHADTKKTQRAVRQVQENLNIIVSEGERLTSLINDVLDIAKIEAGEVEWHMQSTAIVDVIEQAIAAIFVLAQNVGLEIIRDIEPQLPTVMCDRNRLLQVLINLLSNAIKFTDRGSVTCRVRRHKNQLVISVIDTGIGLSQDDLEKVFGKFKQVGTVMTDKPKGTGLGLPICRQIIERHGGRIWAESELGQGSTFSFTLPMGGVPETEASQFNTLIPDPERGHRLGVDRYLTKPIDTEILLPELKGLLDQGPSNRKVLVIDSDIPTIDTLTDVLTSKGYTVTKATTGKDGIEKALALNPDMIIADSAISIQYDLVKTLRSANGLESVFIIMVDQSEDAPPDCSE